MSHQPRVKSSTCRCTLLGVHTTVTCARTGNVSGFHWPAEQIAGVCVPRLAAASVARSTTCARYPAGAAGSRPWGKPTWRPVPYRQIPVKVKVSVISAGIGWVSLSMRMTGYPFACELALTRASPVCAVCWWAWHSKYVRSTGYLHSLPTGYRKGAHLLSEAGGVASHD